MNSLQCTGTSHTSVACRPWERQSETTFVASLRGSPPEYKRRVTAFSSLAGAGSGVPGPAGDATDLQSAGAKQTSSLDDSDLDLPAKYHMHWWDLAKRKSIRTLRDKSDPSLNMTLVSIGSSVSTPFTQDAWERHRSVRRYFANLVTIRTSTVFRRIYKPFMVLSLVATALTVWNGLAPSNLPRLQLAATAHNLLGAAISLLLVFRTNASYGRFQEARKLWGGVVKYSRDGVRLGAAYCSRDVLARLAAYLQAFAWTLKAQLRKGRTRTDPADPTAYKDDPRPHLAPLLEPSEVEELLASHNMPFEAALRLTRLVADLPTGLPDVIRLQLDKMVGDLVLAAGGCERLLGTPVPLSYTRHTSRCMMLWLVTLPAALWPTMGWATAPAAAVVTFILLGIDELGVQIEESFGFLPLGVFCRAVQSDAAAAIKSQQPMDNQIQGTWDLSAEAGTHMSDGHAASPPGGEQEDHFRIDVGGHVHASAFSALPKCWLWHLHHV
eukprot:CAMPEP_0206135346 /NCGR_PEP_ID=MMETSP1473-20131121/646_1 /ASSEMBLY_ACC=CAM_ASM_001109 /TAXON_ID=1461547 /ORGANISM="Stichococcus sp, Strain RCC1054" /LENGTH=495 /DNA_ID=CAMNT_0053527177 /DNA_START=364 /DNA_END=1852 /DNA_ORIENTATION=+